MLLVFSRGMDEIRVICFFQAEDGIRHLYGTGVQTCALPIWCRVSVPARRRSAGRAPARGRPAPGSARPAARTRTRPPLEAGADRDGGPGDQQLDRAHEGGAKALIPVSAWPRISVCTSLVPS